MDTRRFPFSFFYSQFRESKTKKFEEKKKDMMAPEIVKHFKFLTQLAPYQLTRATS